MCLLDEKWFKFLVGAHNVPRGDKICLIASEVRIRVDCCMRSSCMKDHKRIITAGGGVQWVGLLYGLKTDSDNV